MRMRLKTDCSMVKLNHRVLVFLIAVWAFPAKLEHMQRVLKVLDLPLLDDTSDFVLDHRKLKLIIIIAQ